MFYSRCFLPIRLLTGVCNSSKHIDVYVIQILIMNNHMNGKDTHVRGVKVLGPLECVSCQFIARSLTHKTLTGGN